MEDIMPKPATLPDNQIAPPADLERRTRRVLSAEYKLSILQQAAACKHGELGQLLRREKLYSSQLSQWRREFEEHGVAGLGKTSPGPRVSKTAEQRRIEQLEKENQKLRQQLEIKDNCISLQKKALVLIEALEQGSSLK